MTRACGPVARFPYLGPPEVGFFRPHHDYGFAAPIVRRPKNGAPLRRGLEFTEDTADYGLRNGTSKRFSVTRKAFAQVCPEGAVHYRRRSRARAEAGQRITATRFQSELSKQVS